MPCETDEGVGGAGVVVVEINGFKTQEEVMDVYSRSNISALNKWICTHTNLIHSYEHTHRIHSNINVLNMHKLINIFA